MEIEPRTVAHMNTSAKPHLPPGIRTGTFMVGAVTLLLAVHLLLAFRGVVGRSVTADEIAHVTAGCAYWQFNDYRLQPENGNLPQRWGALAFTLGGARLEPQNNSTDWETSMVWLVGQQFFYEGGQNTDFLLLLARTSMLFWSVCTGLLVFFWSRSLWGDFAGLFSLTLYAFSPTVLAHAPLVTSDLCAAFWLLAATGAIARTCSEPNWKRILIAGISVGMACVAKFSAALLIPIAGLLALTAIIRARTGANHRRNIIALSGAAFAAFCITLAVIWTFYGWRYSTASPVLPALRQFYLPWERVFADDGALPTTIGLIRQMQVLPEAFLYGFSHVLYFANERGAFLWGLYSTKGWWWFFPFAFAVKSTVGELIIVCLLFIRIALAAIRNGTTLILKRAMDSRLLPLCVFLLVYGVAALSSNLNIGQRHLLPLYVVLFICAGALVTAAASRTVRFAAILALAGSVAESSVRQPHSLAFFNILAGGPSNGWRLLVDSSLDWGQDVSALAEWLRDNRQPDEPVYLSVFGTADPHYEGINGELLSPYYSLGKPRHWFELEPGLYCISATMLQDVYGIRPGPWSLQLEEDFQKLKLVARAKVASGEWGTEIPTLGFHPQNALWLLDRLRFARMCQYLRLRRPDAVINHTQFVFRLSQAELDIMIDRPFSELAALMERAAGS